MKTHIAVFILGLVFGGMIGSLLTYKIYHNQITYAFNHCVNTKINTEDLVKVVECFNEYGSL